MIMRNVGLNGGRYFSSGNGHAYHSNAFTPRELIYLTLWLTAFFGYTDDGAGAISSWRDQSGNAFAAFTATTTARPTLVASNINSLPAMRYDGVANKSLSVGVLSTLMPVVSQFHVIAVCRPIAITTNAAANQPYLNNGLFGDSLGEFGTAFKTAGTNTFLGWMHNNGDSQYKEATTTAVAVGTAYVLGYRNPGAGTTFSKINGGAEGSVAAQNIVARTGTMHVGINYNGAVYGNVDVADIIQTSRVLSTNDELRVRLHHRLVYATAA